MCHGNSVLNYNPYYFETQYRSKEGQNWFKTCHFGCDNLIEARIGEFGSHLTVSVPVLP